MLNELVIQSLLEAAGAAPSADNRHDWRIAFEADRLRLLLPGWQGGERTRARLNLVSVGAVVESLCLRGTRLGLKLTPQVTLADSDSPVCLKVSSALLAPDPIETELLSRHSNRNLKYRGPALDAPSKQALQAQAQGRAWLQWLDEPKLRSTAVELIGLAERQRFSIAALHAEMYSGVRFDVGWTSTCPHGLPPGSLGVGLLERAGFRAMTSWPLQRSLNLFGAHRMLAFRSAGLPARLSPNLCVIGSNEEDEWEAALSAGRALLRVWCAATKLGLAGQVWAASPIYSLPGATAVPPDIQRQLAKGWQVLVPSGRPYVVLRLGRASPVAVRSGRPDPQSLRT